MSLYHSKTASFAEKIASRGADRKVVGGGVVDGEAIVVVMVVMVDENSFNSYKA